MRLFFALALPDDARTRLRPLLEAARQETGKAVGFSKAEQLHFTLAYLGDQPESEVRAASEAATEAVQGLAPFELSLGGGGAFPGPQRPRVLWLGVRDGAAELVTLAGRLATALRERAFVLEERAFQPHLTLGRVRPHGERAAAAALAKMPTDEQARFPVREIALVHSKLGPGGARHSVVNVFPLAAR